MLAVHELLKAKSLLDRYTATGLDDATTLREAVEQAAGKLEVTGKAKDVVHRATVEGDFAVGYVLAGQSDLTAYLMEPAELEKVRTAYRDVMHRQAGELMQRDNWEDALLLWRHLHQRKLVSQQLYLDAARCFKELGQHADAVRVLNEAMDAFGESGSVEFFEQAGDLALDIQSGEAQSLAEQAYEKAIEGLKETVTGAVLQED
jgi:tetratricopeptide (TPR) repeat protein